MKKEILITDLYAAALEKENISEEITDNKWRVLDYETAKYSGKLLCVGANSTPKSLTLRLNAKGRYDIYLGLMQMRGATTSISLRLSSTEEISHVNAVSNYSWTPLENTVECFWKTAELDGEALILAKPDDYLPHTSALVWIRLVPEDAEYEKSAKISYHFDSDYFADDEYPTPESITGRIDALSDGNAEIILQEGFACDMKTDDKFSKKLFPRAAKYLSFHERKCAIENALINKAHSIGAKIYAAYRIQAGLFSAPNDFGGTNLFFGDDYSHLDEFRCISRDGRRLGVCSYAYPEVRNYIIDRLLTFMERDYDGLCLIFNRGTFVAFEQPVLDEVYRRYGIDARRLPMSDERCRKVRGSFITEFLRTLRRKLDDRFKDRKGINAVVFFTPEDSKSFGFDVEAWVNEGLVDGISQGLMRVYEDLDGCLDEDGLVDLEKYGEQLLIRPIIKREFRFNESTKSLAINGCREFMKICDGRADFYATLLWEAQSEGETEEYAKILKDMGVNKFISWNANHKAKILSRINAEKFFVAGSEKEYRQKASRYYRTLSVGGVDISQFDPNWKG